MTKNAGVLFFLAGTLVLMGIVTAEIFYPQGYSISQSMISTLAASPPPDSIIHEPSAAIFNSVMVMVGLLVMFGASFIVKSHEKKLAFLLGLMGLGSFGVGIFPAFHPLVHPISALIAFGGGGLAAIVSSRYTKPPFSALSLMLGTLALIVLVLGILWPGIIVPVLGPGGTERWVAYPIMIWLIGFGGYLMRGSK